MALLGKAEGSGVSALLNAVDDAASSTEIIRAARPHLTLALGASRWQLRGLSLLAALALMVIPAAQIRHFSLEIFFIVGALLYYEWARKRLTPRFSRLTLQADDTLLLREICALDDLTASVIAPAFVSPWLIALRVRVNDASRATSLIITPDQLSERDFRALRIRLRHWRRFD